MGKKFEVNAVTGSVSLSIPLPVGTARGFGVSLNLIYNSGGGNGIFGLGWMTTIPSVRRKTNRELPQYFDEIDSDTYILAGAEELVVSLSFDGIKWLPLEYNSPDGKFRIKRYRPRIENGFSRIERWTKKSDGRIHWRTISRNNITSVYVIH